jgi:hypothetical protein
MASAYPKACIKLYEVEGVYRVHSCMVWLDNTLAWFLGSAEKYSTRTGAYAEMQQRTMNLLREHGRTETEREVNWEMVSE